MKNRTPASTVSKIEMLYKRSSKTVLKIAKETGVSRSLIFLFARKHGWEKFKRVAAARTRYRHAARNKIGRDIIKWEQVHHKDGDIENNIPDNIHVFQNAKTHTESHKSLEQAAFALYKIGLIKFSEKTGRYFL